MRTGRRMREAADALRTRMHAASQAAGERIYRIADAVAGAPFRRETRECPAPIHVDGVRIDTIDDLIAFTQLGRDVVEHEVLRRRHINFRNEWIATPKPVRSEHWFYLSSKAYLFANAAHFTDDTFVRDFVARHLRPGQRALDFGGGSGELALRLAAAGISTTLVELNALQRDFVRFRVERHGLGDMIDVLDPWASVPHDAFDGVLAIDVVEHLPSPREILEDTLVPALRSSGVFIEDSPFIVDPSNPMHHNDFGFDDFMRERSFSVIDAHGTNTRAWRR